MKKFALTIALLGTLAIPAAAAEVSEATKVASQKVIDAVLIEKCGGDPEASRAMVREAQAAGNIGALEIGMLAAMADGFYEGAVKSGKVDTFCALLVKK